MAPGKRAHLTPTKPRFFKTADAFRGWLERFHETERELLVGFHKVGTGRPSMTWPESVDAALSFGWIDGVRRRIDETSYSVRFTPRKSTSIWSAVNIRRVEALTAAGLMAPAGLATFARRDEKKPAIYSHERKTAALDHEALALLRNDAKAWAYFSAQAPWYRRAAAHWVGSAKREETRVHRLRTLIDCSRRGERIPPLTPSGTAKKKR